MGFLGGLFGGGGGGTAPVLNKNAFDLSSAVQKYGGMTDAQVAAAKQRQEFANQANQQLIQQLQGQTTGQAPSLAQAQLKQMQDRGLAQTIATAASQRGGNPALNARNVVMQQAAAGRENASQGAILGLQERNQAQQLLAGQLTASQGQADQLASGSIGQGFGQENTAKQLMGQYESQRFGADTARQNVIHGQQNAILGGVLGAAGTLAGGYFGGPTGAKIGGAMGSSVGAQPKYDGGMIEGKEVVPGDNPANDTVPAKLSPGEIVIPKSVINAGEDAAHAFVSALMKANLKPKEVGFSAVVGARKMYEGGRVPAPTGEAPSTKDTSEKPVHNQWHGAGEAWENLKKELFPAPTSPAKLAYGGIVKAKKGC